MANTKWFEDWFNTKEYLELYKHRDSKEAKKLVDLLFRHIELAKNSKVLDLACGNGRHSVLFAKRGFDTLGADLSPFLIKQAKLKRKDDYSKYSDMLRFEIRDMRKIDHKNEFDLVVNLFSSFGYFEKDKDNENVIKSISCSLKTGGYFFFDFLNAYYLVKNLVPFSFEKKQDKSFIQLRYIKGKICYKKILIFEPGEATREETMKTFSEQVRLFNLPEFRKMFSRYSMKIVKVFGDYHGKKFSKFSSERLIILAKKK